VIHDPAAKERDQELRRRLHRLDAAPRPAGRATGRPTSLDDLDGVVGRDGVLVVERDASSFMSGRARKALVERVLVARREAEKRDDIDDEVRRLLLKPDGALFVDTETTGLGSAMVFMLGSMRVSDERILLRQLFARDYSEERALILAWTEMLDAADMLVSFNGKSFDLPVLRDRVGFHGLVMEEEPPHLDLLHAARRRWKDVLPDCRLQTLEWSVCGRRRSGDIPGDEIPAAYHRFVRTGDPADMLTVFHHNALDLITLADIAAALATQGDRRQRK
jgi:uncharacterized protein YprB with RNaseH-like and TPR domain